MNAKVTVDTKKYRRNVKKYLRDWPEQRKDVIRSGAQAYARETSYYTPPGIKNQGKGLGPKGDGKTIPEYLYYRPIYFIPAELERGRGNPKEKESDRDALQRGFLYKVRFAFWDGIPKILYFKTEAEAKKYKRVINRGKLKVSFGMNLAAVSAKVPKNIQALLNKSPNLKRQIRLNSVEWLENSENRNELKIVNEATYGNESFFDFARKWGERKAQGEMRKMLKRMVARGVQL